MPAPNIAIDFGTTRTKVAYFDVVQGKPVLIELGREVRAVLPSLFYIPQGDAPRQVGDDAQEMVDVDPEGIVIGLKREIHKVGAKRCGPGRAAVGRVELASDMFSYIRRRCGDEVFHAQVTACILTVPVAFEEQKRECLRRAAELGGFKRISLIDEPVAAARAWVASRSPDNHENVIVCDVGGGTTDLALLRLRRGEFEPEPDVLPDGILLGGNDVDEKIWDSMVRAKKGDGRLDSRRSGFLVKLRKIKELISRDTRTNIPVVLGADRLTLPREAIGPCVHDFNSQIVEMVRKFVEHCQQSGVDTKSIPLLLVGGASRTPGLKEELERIAVPRVLSWNEADYATVLGAAEQRCLNSGPIRHGAPPVVDDDQSVAEAHSTVVKPPVVFPAAISVESATWIDEKTRLDSGGPTTKSHAPRPTSPSKSQSTAANLAIGCFLVVVSAPLLLLCCGVIATIIIEGYPGPETGLNSTPNSAGVAPKESTIRQLPPSKPPTISDSTAAVKPAAEPTPAVSESPKEAVPPSQFYTQEMPSDSRKPTSPSAAATDIPPRTNLPSDTKPQTNLDRAVENARKLPAQNAHSKATSRGFENSINMKFAFIPSGEFDMGSPDSENGRKKDERLHHVRLTSGFYFGVHEVTQSQFQQVMGRNPAWFSKEGGSIAVDSGQDTGSFPVDTVSWYDAVEFCNAISKGEGLPAYYALRNVERNGNVISNADVAENGGTGYRLPTEAEWEYACRAGTKSPFHFGSVLNTREANVDGKSPREVGNYAANKFGLYDMHGNVMEWCNDGYVAYGGDSVDPKGPRSANSRVLRGGSFQTSAAQARSASRWPREPRDRYFFYGFRVAKSYK